MFEVITFPLIGFLVAVSVGLSGIGGAAFLVPALVWLGVPPHEVVGSTLLYIFLINILTSVLHQRERNVNFTSLKYLATGIVPAILLGTLAFLGIRETYGDFILDTVIVLGTGILLTLIATLMVIVMISARASKVENGKTGYDVMREPSIKGRVILASSGFMVSFFMQLTSVGAGSLLVPILLRIIRSPRHAAGTSAMYALLVTALGSLLHFSVGNVPLLLVGLLVVGAIPGVYFGVKRTTKIRPLTLGIVAALLILLAGVLLLIRGVTPFL